MQVEENISLRPFHTFGIQAKARYFARFSTVEELGELTERHKQDQLIILGGGSNVLFTDDVNGIVLKNEVSGITKLHEDREFVYVRAGAGENWHGLVQYCIQRDWAGLENLSLIPGNVGASPMQNIGAYGVELRDVFFDLDAWHREEKKIYTFTASDCEFGYRESVFKNKWRHQFVILNVTFRLRKVPVFHTSYGAVEQELEKMGVRELSIRAVSEAIIRIRSSKLPDPAVIGNAGSFFKNPEVPAEVYESLKKEYPAIVGYTVTHEKVKLAAGWLIEQCGWKGYRKGDAGCHEKQALVLVNYGRATGKEILDISQRIQADVDARFGVKLVTEVNII